MPAFSTHQSRLSNSKSETHTGTVLGTQSHANAPKYRTNTFAMTIGTVLGAQCLVNETSTVPAVLYEPKYWYGTRHAVFGKWKPVPYKGGCSFAGFSVGFCHLSNRLWRPESLASQRVEIVVDSAHVPAVGPVILLDRCACSSLVVFLSKIRHLWHSYVV